jgi:signal transduction histidine kinase
VLRVGQVVALANHTLLLARHGKEIAIDDSAAPIRDAAGEMVGVVLVFRDISEKRAAAHQAEERRLELLVKERALASEKAMREMEAELARVLRAMSVNELASSIAHEVNQPLAGMLTNAEAGLRWLNGASPDIEEVRRSLTLIARDANRAGAVIQRIREFLKKEPPRTTPLDLNAITREAVTLLASDLARRRIELRTDLAGDLPLVRGDRVQLQQVIVNLLMNGAEAMASATEAKRLVISTRRSGGEAFVAGRDSGAGISPADLSRMFQAFFTTKPGGIGMGLSISRSIMEAHGGRIWAEANQGPGLTVSFSLPAASGGAETPQTGRPS